MAVPRPGRVRWTGALRGLGEAIIVEHDGDLVTVLAGVDAAVDVGAEVPAGGVVGRAAATRMYLEVRHAGEPVDPEPLLP